MIVTLMSDFGEVWSGSLGYFLQSNDFEPDHAESIRAAMQAGERFDFGGGAEAHMWLLPAEESDK